MGFGRETLENSRKKGAGHQALFCGPHHQDGHTLSQQAESLHGANLRSHLDEVWPSLRRCQQLELQIRQLQ